MPVSPGFVALPAHNKPLVERACREVQPSVLVLRNECASAELQAHLAGLAPQAHLMYMDGPFADSLNTKSLDQFMARPVRDIVNEAYTVVARMRDQGWRGHFKAWNEPPVWASRDFRKKLTEVYVQLKRRCHAEGILTDDLHISVSWPWANHVDVEDWWPDFLPVAAEQTATEAVVVHEYLPGTDSLGLQSFPWRGYKHKLIPPQFKRIVIGEFGVDHAVLGGPHRGWSQFLSAEQYRDLIRSYLSNLDPRVQGVAIFLLDHHAREWMERGFCVDPLIEQGLLTPGALQGGQPLYPVPQRLPRTPLDVPMRLTQRFGERPEYYRQFGVAGHNGVDFGPTRTGDVPVYSVDRGVVFRVRDEGSKGYGRAVWINHGYGTTLYAHLERWTVSAQQEVQPGQTIGLMGNTGNSTGKHLHFGLLIYGQHDAAMNDWRDPAPLLNIAGQQPPEVETMPEDLIRNRLWNAIGQGGVIAYNRNAAFAKQARALGLGAPLTNERDVDGYRAQGFALGIVAARIGDWGNIQRIAW